MAKTLIIIRLYDKTYGENGNPETLAIYLDNDNTLDYSLYTGWQSSGIGCSISNLQLRESLPTSAKRFKTTEALYFEIAAILRTGVGSHYVKKWEILNEIVEKKPKTIKPLSKKPEVWIGLIPDIHGYGLNVLEFSEDLCRKALKREFRAMQKSWHGELTFPQAMENFGGRIEKIEPGKAYFENFGN